MNELIDKTKQWFHDKGIIANSDPLKQLGKSQEELTETRDAVVRYDTYLNIHENSILDTGIEQDRELNEIKDGIGDTMVTLIGVCEMWNKDISELVTNPAIESYINGLPDDRIRILEELQSLLLRLYLFTATSNSEAAYVTMGMMVGCLFALSEEYGTRLEECLQQAYDVISKRSGTMIDGVFVKSK
jgi:hypothetical protein